MKKIIENVFKNERTKFKELFAADKVKITFSKDKAFLHYQEPYTIDEQSLMEKGKIVNHWRKMVPDFRMYQFNNFKGGV